MRAVGSRGFREQLTDRIVRQEPGALQSLHRHVDWRLIVYLDGVTQEGSFGEAARFERGDFKVRPSFYMHANLTCAAGAAYVRLDLSGRACRNHFKRHGWRAMRGRVDLDALDLARRAAIPGGGDDLLALAMDKAYRPAAPQSHLQNLAALLMQASPPALGLAAESMGLRPYQLTRRFARAFGLCPRAYQRQARLQRALAMLAEGADSIAHIAAATGFHDQSHLSHELKRETGLTPRGFAGACS